MGAEQNRKTLRYQLFELLERGRRGDWSSLIFDYSLLVLILANVGATVIGTVADIQAQHGPWLLAFDRICVAIFILEYLIRIWTAPEHPAFRHLKPAISRVRFATTPLMVIDLASILPFFVEILFGPNLAAVRVLRLIRFFRLTRYSPALVIIGRVLASEWRALAGCAVIFVGLLLIASSLMYAAEGHLQPDKLGDIPSAMWWAIVTLSTVGYGDVLPVTVIGKIIAGVVMVLGLVFLALPVGIIATGFQEEIHRSDFVVSFGMVARVPLFAKLDAKMIAHLVGLLHARKVGDGAMIVRKGDEADGMYFIASGAVDVELPSGNVRLGEGDFFGEIALLKEHAKRTATVISVRPTELLKLDARDFHRLMARSPELSAAVKEVANLRQSALQS